MLESCLNNIRSLNIIKVEAWPIFYFNSQANKFDSNQNVSAAFYLNIIIATKPQAKHKGKFETYKQALLENAETAERKTGSMFHVNERLCYLRFLTVMFNSKKKIIMLKVHNF